MSPVAKEPGTGEVMEVLITRACDMCRKKKIRCEPTSHACVQCIKYKTQCNFTPIKVKRKPRRPAGQPRVDELEKRLKKMEEQLRIATQRNKQVATEAETPSNSMEIARQHSPLPDFTVYPDSSSQSRDEWSSSQSSNLTGVFYDIHKETAPILFLSDGFSSINRVYDQADWNLRPSNGLFSRRIFKQLPPKPEAIRLIYKSFESFNSVFPLFDQDSFLKMLEYSEADFNDTAWWACVNVVLALSHRFDSLRSKDSVAEDRKAWAYFQNALSVSTELSMLHSNLSAVQALLGMAVIIQGTPDTGPFSSLLSSGIKLAHSMGLHRRQQPPGLSVAEIELRKQVFWTAYFLDKDLSIRTGQPPNQDEDEMDVELPFQAGRSRWCGPPNGVHFFLARVSLAEIQGQVYKLLCSVKATKQSAPERKAAVKYLHEALHKWKAHVPINFDEEYYKPTLEMPDISPIMHTVTLRLSYFKTLSTIHQMSAVSPSGSLAPLIPDKLSLTHILPPSINCVEEARKAIKLLHVTPREDYGCIWVVLHIFISATTLILTYIISNPSSPLAASDLTLIEPLLRLLGALAAQGKSEEVASMYARCNELWGEATGAVWLRAQHSCDSDLTVDELLEKNKSQVRGEKESEEGKESLEDFIRRIERISQGDEELAYGLPG